MKGSEFRIGQLSTESIQNRFEREFFSKKILDNSLRGYWCEAMVAEAIGDACEVVSSGWAPWDLQIGSVYAAFPDRLRLQVKNSARRQIWHTPESAPSECLFNLNFRTRPQYFCRDHPNVPCEEIGFMCDLFVLCYHNEADFQKIDQRDPEQWRVFLVPASPEFGRITQSEVDWVLARITSGLSSSSLQRRPATMELGIRNRSAIKPIPLTQLSIDDIKHALKLT